MSLLLTSEVREDIAEQLVEAASVPSKIVAIVECLVAKYGDQVLALLPTLLDQSPIPKWMIPIVVAIASGLVHLQPAPTPPAAA